MRKERGRHGKLGTRKQGSNPTKGKGNPLDKVKEDFKARKQLPD